MNSFRRKITICIKKQTQYYIKFTKKDSIHPNATRDYNTSHASSFTQLGNEFFK